MTKKLSRPLKRYITIGVCVYIFELAVIVVAQALGATAVTAIAISFWLGLLVSFTLQKFITFGDRRVHHKVLIPQVIAYGLLVLFNFGFTVVMTKLLSGQLPAVIIRTLAIGMTTLWNFYLYRTRIFKTDSNNVY